MGTKLYRIHPGIGIARLGSSTNDYFIGPEAPFVVPFPDGPYRDSDGFLKRQGAKFRIYEYEYDIAGRLIKLKEITGDDATICWSVRLVNKKAASPVFPPGSGRSRNPGTPPSQLIIDAGSQTIDGINQSLHLVGAFKGTTVDLGDLRTDEKGRLIVLGGHGRSKSVPSSPLTNFANNPNWHDDVSDGPVAATVTLDGQPPVDCDPAWIIVAPPSYAPAINSMVTLWDQALDVAVELDATLEAELVPVSFTRDIYPILKRTVNLQWVSQLADSGHGGTAQGNFLLPDTLAKLSNNDPANRPAREGVYRHLARPDGSGGDMPLLNGGLDPQNPNRQIPMTLTPLQFRLMKYWQLGNFAADWPGSPPVPPPFGSIPVDQQPNALDRAALDACIGGPFFPGIEGGFPMARRDTYRAPFRIDEEAKAPGDITAGMACPWQADFLACGRLWWPAQRPNWVIRDGQRADWTPPGWQYADMVEKWDRLGFILQEGDQYVEKEQAPLIA